MALAVKPPYVACAHLKSTTYSVGVSRRCDRLCVSVRVLMGAAGMGGAMTHPNGKIKRVRPIGKEHCPRCCLADEPGDCGITTSLRCTEETPCAWMKPPASWTACDELVMCVDRLQTTVDSMARRMSSLTPYRHVAWCARIAEPWNAGRVMTPACQVIQSATSRIKTMTNVLTMQDSVAPRDSGHWLVRAALWIVHRLHSLRAGAFGSRDGPTVKRRPNFITRRCVADTPRSLAGSCQ